MVAMTNKFDRIFLTLIVLGIFLTCGAITYVASSEVIRLIQGPYVARDVFVVLFFAVFGFAGMLASILAWVYLVFKKRPREERQPEERQPEKRYRGPSRRKRYMDDKYPEKIGRYKWHDDDD